MITVIYLPNPFNPNERIITRLEEEKINSILELSDFLGINKPEEVDWFINGRKEDNIMLQLTNNSYVVVFPKIEKGHHGKNIATIIAGIALIAVTGGLGGFALAGAGTAMVMGNTLGMGLVMMGVGGLLTGNTKMPSYDISNDIDSSYTGGYSWSPSKIQTKQGSAIPVTYGTFRTSGMLLNKRIETNYYNIASGAGVASSFNRLCLLLSAGENVLDSLNNIKINDTAINLIPDCESQIMLRNGATEEKPFFREVVEELPSGVEVPIWAGTTSEIVLTFTQELNVGDDVYFTFSYPNGAYAIDTQSGAKKHLGLSLSFMIEAKLQGQNNWDGASYDISPLLFKTEPFFAHATFSVTDWQYSTSPFKRGNGIYNIRITTTQQSKPQNISFNAFLYTVDLVRYSSKVTPGLALVALKIPASSTASGGLPSVSWEQTRNYVYVWNPNNNSYEQKDAHNIAWMVYDLIHYCRKRYDKRTSTYVYEVEGEPANRISYTDFVAWANFCAQTINGVPRACGNLLLDSTEKVWTTIQEIASFGRGFIVQQAGIFKPIWETAAAMTQIFTSGNIVQGSFSGGYLTDEERATAIEATFIDEDNNYESTTILVHADNYNPYDIENTAQIRIKGLTNSKAVYSYCRFLLRKNKYIRRYVKFTADIDSIVAQIGDVIGVQSDVPVWGVGGRLLGATATQLVLDTEVNLEVGSTYRVIVRMSDDSLVTKTVDSVAANVKTNTLKFTNSPFSTVPNIYDVYSFGVINNEIKKFRINTISRNGDLQATIEATEYIEAVYDDTETNIPVLTYNTANCRLSGLIATPNAQEGTISISWQPDMDTVYDGAIVLIDGVPQGFFSSEQLTFITTQSAGEHTIKVTPVHGSEYGTSSETTVTLGTQSLGVVTGINLSSELQQQSDQTNLIFINGTFTKPVTGINVLVEVQEGSGEWKNVQSSSNNSFRISAKPLTTYNFRFTAFNNNISSEPVTATITTAGDSTAPSAPTVTVSAPSVPANIVQNLNLTVTVSLANPPEDMAGFYLYRRADYTWQDSSILLGFLPAKNGKATFTDVIPTQKQYFYWAKSVDVWGNTSAYSAYAGYYPDTTAPAAPTLTASVIKQTTVGLTIELTNPPDDMAGFYLYRNANNTSSTATLLAFISAKDGKATFTDLTPSIGNYYYWAKSADVWGNNSAFSSVASVTTQAVVADEVAATALSMPTGSILRLSAKGCTTASIANDNGVIDVSGNGHHTKAYGDITVGYDEGGAYFDTNTNGYIAYNNNFNYLSDKFSVRIRFRTHVYPSTDALYICSLNNNTSYEDQKFSLTVNQYGRYILGVEGYQYFWITDNTSYIRDVVITRNSSNVVTLYVNGVKKNTFNVTQNLTRANLTLGCRSANSSGATTSRALHWQGRIYAFQVFDYDLSETQVKSLYMFPDEALFAQLTADLIGANVVTAKNLVKTEALITETAQISQAIVKDLVVTNGVTIGDLNTTAQNANTTATSANTKIDNLQVGGVNRFKQLASPNKGSLTNNNKSWQFVAKTYYSDTYAYFKLYEDLKAGDIITISCDVSGFASNDDFMSFSVESQSYTPYLIIKNGRCSITHTMRSAKNADSGIALDDMGGGNMSVSAEATVTLSNFKVEKGNMATDYSPAPEDTDSLIATAQGKADSAYSNNQATQTQLDNLQVGGRNLLLNTETAQSGTSFAYYLSSLGKKVSAYNSGSKFVIKFEFECSVENTSILLWFRDINQEQATYRFNYTVEGFSGTIIIYSSSFTRVNSVLFEAFRIASNTTGSTITITNIKLEEGNTPTTWTPAPEDVDADISTAQTTANTAVSNAATAQSGVNTLNEIVMPNGEILSLTADNFNTDTRILDDDIGFQNSLQNTYASNPVTLKLDKEQGCYIEFVQDETNSKFQSMYELLNRHQNAYFITDVTDLNANGYTIWTRVRLRDLTVHTDAGDIYAGIFCLGNYGNHGISLRNNNAIYASINFPSVSADTVVGWGFSDYVNKWIDICFTADSVNAETRKIKLYLNGVLKENKTTTTQITSGQAGSVIARGGGAHNSGFTNMDFKAAKVWNRPLTAGEVAGLTKYFNTTGSATAKNINNAQSTADTANTTANTALGRINGVMTTDYTNIQGGKIKTGIIASGSFDITTYRNNSTGAVDGTKTYDSTNQRYHGGTFTTGGSCYDLDYGEIHTPYFYSNESGAGIKGHVEADTGSIGKWDLDNGLLSLDINKHQLDINTAGIGVYQPYIGLSTGKIGSSVQYSGFQNDIVEMTYLKSSFQSCNGLWFRTYDLNDNLNLTQSADYNPTYIGIYKNYTVVGNTSTAYDVFYASPYSLYFINNNFTTIEMNGITGVITAPTFSGQLQHSSNVSWNQLQYAAVYSPTAITSGVDYLWGVKTKNANKWLGVGVLEDNLQFVFFNNNLSENSYLNKLAISARDAYHIDFYSAGGYFGFSGHIKPYNNNAYQLGVSGAAWSDIYTNKINGNSITAVTSNTTATNSWSVKNYGMKIGALIVNWGVVTRSGSTNNSTVTFAISFSDTNYSLVLAPYNRGIMDAQDSGSKVSKSQANFVINGSNQTINYIAIGI